MEKNIETAFAGQIMMENVNEGIALRRGAASLERRILAGTARVRSEGIISIGAFPSANGCLSTGEGFSDEVKTSGRKSTNIRKPTVTTLLRLVSTQLNKYGPGG